MTNTHLGDTVDFYNGFVRGWEVNFQDINDVWEYLGGLVWNSCDKRNTLALAWVTGPEQLGNNDNYRTVVSAYYTRKFGCRNQWRFVIGGHAGWDANAAVDAATGAVRDAEWYGYSSNLFYTVDPV